MCLSRFYSRYERYDLVRRQNFCVSGYWKMKKNSSIQIYFVRRGPVSDIMLTRIVGGPGNLFALATLRLVIRCDTCIIPIKSPRKRGLNNSDVFMSASRYPTRYGNLVIIRHLRSDKSCISFLQVWDNEGAVVEGT